ncbi:MAG TPA: glycosyl hydrolase 108 family protein, partial [Coleofasciculaceae cyanobacterium]
MIRAAWRMAQQIGEIVKLRQHRQRRQPIEMALLLIWILVGLLLSHEVWQGTALSQPPQFASAFDAVVQLGETAPDYVSMRSGLPSKFGISQSIYDVWQQTHHQAPRSVAELSQAEAKAVYQDFWQQGQCSQYQPPLDIACLDSMVSFGVEAGSSFFAGLPENPKAA